MERVNAFCRRFGEHSRQGTLVHGARRHAPRGPRILVVLGRPRRRGAALALPVEDQIRRTCPFSFKANGRLYFVRFLDHGLKGKTAPLDLAKTAITELLLQRRRQQLREALRDTCQRAWAEGELRRENL